MTNDDNEKIEQKEVTNIDELDLANGDNPTSSKIEDTKIVNGSRPTKANDTNNSNGFSLILLPTLLFKFTIVMLVKFATDIVVFPLLWSYRLIRMCKRKLFRGLSRVFGRGGSDEGGMDVIVNGDSS